MLREVERNLRRRREEVLLDKVIKEHRRGQEVVLLTVLCPWT